MEDKLRTLLAGYNTPYQALSLLREEFRSVKQVRDLKVAYVANFRNREIRVATPRSSVAGLKEWVEGVPNSPPEDWNEYFVLEANCKPDGSNFYVVLSSRNLLANADRGLGKCFVHIDIF